MPEVVMPKDHPYTEGVTIRGRAVKPGQAIDVDADTAASLVDQGWSLKAAKTSGAAKAAKTSPAPADEPDAPTGADHKEP